MARSSEKMVEPGTVLPEEDSAKKKKRKIDHIEGRNEEEIEGDVNTSKEERRQAKKARRAAGRLGKGSHEKTSPTPKAIGNGTLSSAPRSDKGTTTTGTNAIEASCKPRKGNRKPQAANNDGTPSTVTKYTSNIKDESMPNSEQTTSNTEIDASRNETIEGMAMEAKEIRRKKDKAAAKAARKARKVKEQQEAKDTVPSGHTQGATEGQHDEPVEVELHDGVEADSGVLSTNGTKEVENDRNHVSDDRGSTSKVARKLEKENKKRLKALRKTQNGISSDTLPAMSCNGDNRDSKGSVAVPNSTSTTEPSYIEDPVLSSLPQSEIESFLTANFITITDPSSKSPLRPITTFSFLPKSATTAPSPFVEFKAPTPIQAAAWPFLLSKRDMIGVAETGSGKTLAFGVPCIRSILSHLSSSSEIKPKAKPASASAARAVVVSPTRELAVQIHEQLEKLAKPANLSTACIYGGVPKDPQRTALANAHIIVATPGRLNDLIEEGAADLSQVHYLVLDEADRMLDKGFEDAIRTIISCTPSTSSGRQTLMFTATWPPSVRDLAATFMHEPVHIAIGKNNPSGELRANTRITQKVEVLEPEAKQSRLLQIIREHQGSIKNRNDRILVFCLYKKEAVRIEGYLHSKGLRVAGIHGDLSQDKRMASLEAFKNGSCPLLVATDVAARGLDIPAVKLVLNVTFPLTVEDYVHRIGRTGRAGQPGLAITLFTVHDKALSGALINVLRAAGQEVPDELLKFGGTVKKKEHAAYGAFVKDLGDGPKVGTKIRFD